MWLGAESAQHARALDEWARAHDTTLSAPKALALAPLAQDPAIADDVERALVEARRGIEARDAAAIDASLARAEKTLLDHPELPQAAWLLAEVLRARALAWTLLEPGKKTAEAEAAWGEANALDGGRRAGVVEQVSAAEAQRVRAMLAIDDAEGTTAWLDGVPVSPGALERSAGRHQLLVARGGVPVYATWVDWREGGSVRVSAAAIPACSKADVARAHASPRGDAVDARAVRCASWIAVLPLGEGSLRVARCGPGACGPLLEWRATGFAPPPPRPPETPVATKWPAWATWTLVGVGAGVLAGAAVIGANALAPTHTETRFVSGGVRVQ